MSDDRIELAKSHKYFYRDNYRRLCNLLIGALGLMVILSGLIAYFYTSQPLPDFYATCGDGKLVPLTPMSTPNNSSTPLIQ